MNTSLMNTSLWKALAVDKITYPALNKNLEVDVAIVGGGITGLTAALKLVEAGKKVAVFEVNRIGEGTTGFSTGNLYVATQPYYYNIVSKFGEDAARLIAQSRLKTIDAIEAIVRDKKIDCHFARRPWYIHTNNDDKVAKIEKEIATQQKLGIPVEYVNDIPLPLSIKKAAKLDHQARFNPLQYCMGLADYLKSKDCFIFENSGVTDYKEKDDMCHLTVNDRQVTAKKMILATHTPIGFNLTQMYLAPYRSYVVSVELEDKKYPDGNFWDVDNPHHAISTHPAETEELSLLMIAGNHHKTGQSNDMAANYQKHEDYLRKHFNVHKIAYRWSAQHYHSADDVPYIGLATRAAKHTYLATGYFADGLVYGALAGDIISQLILSEDNSLSDIYRAQRFKPIASMPAVLTENANVFWQFLKDMTAPSLKDYEEIKSGEGRVVKIDGEKCAVSRDQHNNLHIVSAICPHMKCTVHWNNAEMTWDCPCHGSRFTQEGKYIEGPAESDLARRG